MFDNHSALQSPASPLESHPRPDASPRFLGHGLEPNAHLIFRSRPTWFYFCLSRSPYDLPGQMPSFSKVFPSMLSDKNF